MQRYNYFLAYKSQINCKSLRRSRSGTMTPTRDSPDGGAVGHDNALLRKLPARSNTRTPTRDSPDDGAVGHCDGEGHCGGGTVVRYCWVVNP